LQKPNRELLLLIWNPFSNTYALINPKSFLDSQYQFAFNCAYSFDIFVYNLLFSINFKVQFLFADNEYRHGLYLNPLRVDLWKKP